MSDTQHSTGIYWKVFFALLIFTFLTVAQAKLITLDHTVNRVIGVLIATTKASLVALFFMHLKYEKKYFYPVVIFPLILVLVIIFANFPDVAFGEHTTPAVELKHEAGGGH